MKRDLLCRLFDDVVERISVKAPDNAVFDGLDGCCSRCVIKEGQLTEACARHVSLERCGLGVAFEDLGAKEATLLQDVHAVTDVTLLDDQGACGCLHLTDGIDDDIELMFIESVEHESLQQPFSQTDFGLFTLSDYWCLEIALFVPLSVYFRRDACPGSGLLFLGLRFFFFTLVGILR